MPLTLDRGDHSAQIVGRTPWSARVPLDPLFAREIIIIHTAARRRGRRLRTGGSAPQSMQTARHWQSKRHWALSPAHLFFSQLPYGLGSDENAPASGH